VFEPESRGRQLHRPEELIKCHLAPNLTMAVRAQARQDPRSVEISKRAGDKSLITGDFIIYPRCYPQLRD
jgi:hypothetical protein